MVPPTPPTKAAQVTKEELRTELKKRRKAFVLEHKNRIPFNPNLLDLIPGPLTIGGYVATRWEADISDWWPALRQSGSTIALPTLANRTAEMEFRRWNDGQSLEKAPFGFEQPSAQAAPEEPDIILIPLVGFDRSGTRLGHGAGHYDRYLASYSNALKIGVGFLCQEYPCLVKDPWDIALDHVITEREWITCVSTAENQ